jgi:transcriptional regulator with XRE-family HTH domain
VYSVDSKEADVFPINLRRLLYFHHSSAREAARVLGVAEHTLSAWLTGKRRPGAAGLMAIDRTYHISPRDLDLPPADFAQLLADRERMAEAEEICASTKAASPSALCRSGRIGECPGEDSNLRHQV